MFKNICYSLKNHLNTLEIAKDLKGTDYHNKIKETLFIEELNATLNANLTSDKKLSLY